MPTTRFDFYVLAFLTTIMSFGVFILQLWLRERRKDAEMKVRELARADERETRRLKLEEKRLEAEESARYAEERARDEAATAQSLNA